MHPVFDAQLMTYLRLMQRKVGLMLNFNSRVLREGIKRVILPERNEGEIAEIPEHERGDLEFVYVDRIEKALAAAL